MSKYADLFRTEIREVPFREEPETALSEERRGFTLLFVDDEPETLKALRRIFLEENYTILTAASGEEALEIMEGEPVHLVISDHRMPVMTGAELLKEIKRRWPETIRIMLTGYADVQSIMGAVNDGAVYKFITKPWNDEDLRLTVSLALQQYVLLQENRKLKAITKKQSAKIKNYAAQTRGIMGSILVRAGVLPEAAFEQAQRAKQNGECIGETLVRLHLTTEAEIVRTLQKQLHVDAVDLRELQVPREVARVLPRNLCERNRMIPIRLDGRQITLAMADPSDIFLCDDIALMTGLKVVPVVASLSDIFACQKRAYGEGSEADLLAVEGIPDIDPLDEIDIIIEEEDESLNIQELIGSSEVPPIIRIVNAVISEAIRYQASDIHIEPKTKHTVIRYRIDGMLHSKIRIPAELHPAAVSRIKILAKIDISERRKPQDGRISVKAGTRIVDIRVSTMPTINGEKVVMRMLDKSSAVKNLDDLGVLPEDLGNIRAMTKKPQGMIITTGPTGSGKTTMLYSILGEMLQNTKNYETIEDPVEYFVEEANQVYVREKIGLSFASVLRATLRQDPDVILVGEIRDYETADVAFKAALTGHMVLTSLHTNSAVASVTRLMDMGIKPYLIASALEGILAQRLVRRICRYCKTEGPPAEDLLELLKIPRGALGEKTFHGEGCGRCNGTGYLGRMGIFEIFVMNDDFRHLISSRYKESELLTMARAGGMRTLIEDGLAKVQNGETTVEELLRVIGTQTRHERPCEHCGRRVDAKFLFCPYCGAFKQHFCRTCRIPLEEDWRTCPSCGAPQPQDITLSQQGGEYDGAQDTDRRRRTPCDRGAETHADGGALRNPFGPHG